jgi:hypothetical protein
MSYNPHAWYWRDDAGNVFSSAAGAMIPPDDANYKAWLGFGLMPTPWPRDEQGNQTPAALDEVLAPYGLKTNITSK